MQPESTKRRAPRPRVECRCRTCGNDFLQVPSLVEEGKGSFCSRACYLVNVVETSTRIHRTCEVCSKPFAARPSRIAVGKARFCSRACSFRSKYLDRPGRLWARVNKTEDCWDWTGGIDPNGYGCMTLASVLTRTHRLAWELATEAAIPSGKLIGHTCDRRICVRNDDFGVYIVNGVEYERHGHLWLATHDANAADRVAKGRSATGHRNGSWKMAEARRIARRLELSPLATSVSPG